MIDFAEFVRGAWSLHARSLPMFGEIGVRDPGAPCRDFVPGEPVGRCDTDGHYMCRECVHGRFCETCDQIEARCECPVDDEPEQAR